MEEKEFLDTLEDLINKKFNWINEVCLGDIIDQYRLFHTCIKNLYDLLVRRSAIVADPYKLDKRIVDIELPDTIPFSDQELPIIFGARLSEYESMLDFICTYFRFTVENMSLNTIKKLVSFNNFFDWGDMSVNNNKVNTKAFANALDVAKKGGDNVLVSSITDSINKCGQTTTAINKALADLTSFKREQYKCLIRGDLMQHPDFRMEKALQSEDNEMAEIRRLYTKVMGKKTFYSDLINEIIKEDQAPDKEKRREALFKKLRISGTAQSGKKKKKKDTPDSRNLLLAAVASLGIVAPIIGTLHGKVAENFDLLFTKKNSFFSKLGEFFKKVLGLQDKKRVVMLPVKDLSLGTEKTQRLEVNEFLHELLKKEHIYSGIGVKGPEYQRIEASSDEATLNFLNTQISELQSTYNTIRSLDMYFKSEIDIMLKPRIKGVQMELSTFRNAIINVNKKRGEYVSYKEEISQMEKLGISDDYE